MRIERIKVQDALDGVAGLGLLRGVIEDAASRAVLDVLTALIAPEPDAEAIADAYARAFAALAAVAGDEPAEGLSDAWQAHLTARLIDDANPWSAQAEAWGPGGVGAGLRRRARHELRRLRLLFEADALSVCALVGETIGGMLPVLSGTWEPWIELAGPTMTDGGNAARTALRLQLAETEDWAALDGTLEAHWARHGTGLIARYRALRWEGRDRELRGIAHPDPIRLDALIGYKREQGLLAANIERFLAGLPAQDALLYGPPGTGKSSTVKAIANAYADRGLRLIEVRKDDLQDLLAIAATVRGRAPRFLLFVDDLSFEEHETEYKALKALLEGTAEARPANLLIYVTTNRRNLIRENFADRGVPGDDVHGRDTMQEKISLAARFGLRVTFPAPDQERYVEIATALARQRGIDLPEDEIRQRALLWDRQHPGRSGRTARQFIDDLQGTVAGHRPHEKGD